LVIICNCTSDAETRQRLASPPLRLETPTQERWAKSDKEKAAVFAKHLADVFQPHEQQTGEEMLEFLESPSQSAESIKTYHTKGYKRRNRSLKYEKSALHGLNDSKNAKGITPGRHGSTHLLIQCHSQTSILA